VVSTNLFAQSEANEGQEVYLEFRHRGVISNFVISYYKDDSFYLPINDLFSLLELDYNENGLVLSGAYSSEQTEYKIDLNTNLITFGSKTFPITSDDYLVKELGYYITPKIFYDVFALDFSIDFNTLKLDLKTLKDLPVVQRALRSQKRRLADANRFEDTKFDLRFDRNTPFLDGGFLDYNLSSNISESMQIYNFNTNIGLQLYGGDLEGTVFGSYSEDFSNFATNNLRWRRFFRNQNIITKLTLGQTQTEGLLRSSYTGVRISNEPIEPRRLFDEFEVQGSTVPQSEVELYLNNALIDFQVADEGGSYRFLTPLTYGSTQMNLKIYGPTGQIIERSNRIQVPFNFQPKGLFNYTVNVGQLDNPIIGTVDNIYTAQASGTYGISERITLKSGVEYYQDYHTDLPTFTSTLSSRIGSSYIYTLEGASNAYYRTTLSAIYPNSASFNLDYIDFNSGFSIYNPSNDNKRLNSSLFLPFQLFNAPLNLRISAFSRFNSTSNTTTFRADLNTRINKLNFRFGFTDRYIGEFDVLNPTNTATLEGSVTYNISRNRNLPAYLRGAFLRGQMRFLPVNKEIESVQLFASQNVFGKGRVQLALGRNMVNNFNSVRFSLILDFDKLRSSSNISSIRNNYNYTQNIRGSIGYDSNYNNFLFTSRDQVGRSGSAVKLFVDNNNNGIFDDEDDEISDNAVRVNRSGAVSTTKNGILYFTQMQPYFYYNMEMNKGAIRNPMLVPDFEKFGLITDPNRFKKVEIPFYMSGVIEGTVEKLFASGTNKGIAGLKLLVVSDNNEFSQEIRTFSDGSFYAYEIPPGKYTISIDKNQLDILDSEARPGNIEFNVNPIPEGDFIEGLYFSLVPKNYEEILEETIPVDTILADISQTEEIIQLKAEYEQNIDQTLRLIIQAQASFYNRDIDRALVLVNESLSLFKTAQGYALRGSLYYLKGNKIEAQKSWDFAVELNPDIFIPDIEVLDQYIRTQPGN
tara:strand:+ start:13138 stop:16065 length:2928 start_codon:yes stop_codon:yes gene_type:complete